MDSAARQRFLADYSKIRNAEGRGSTNAEYYRALPYRDLSGNNTAQWRVRARSYQSFQRHILSPMEQQVRRPLHILDLGAGNGWLSYQYPISLPGIAAEFDSLPFKNASFDVLVFNSSFYLRTLSEARRCLGRSGLLVIMDSPLYECRAHGEMMRAERQGQFEKLYGFRSEAQQSIEYLDRGMPMIYLVT